MTQELELLLKDLYSRLPYGVKCYGFQMKIDGNDNECYGVLKNISDSASGWKFMLDDRVPLNNRKCYEEVYYEVKPYLFPLSSMTEEQRKEYDSIIYYNVELHADRYYEVIDVDSFELLHDFYHKNHLDYRGLIPMGLAIDATNLNIY
jgi:hypothetical protein